jgi:hypothetical protein
MMGGCLQGLDVWPVFKDGFKVLDRLSFYFMQRGRRTLEIQIKMLII